jgi:hypothetical protein
LIGATCLARLHAGDHQVVGAGRKIANAQRAAPIALCVMDHCRSQQAYGARGWLPLLHGVDAVVNSVGVLQDGLRDDVQRVLLNGTKALFDGCVRAGVSA